MEKGDRLRHIGKIVSGESSRVSLTFEGDITRREIRVGDELILESWFQKASLARRKSAVESILSSSSIIPDLINFINGNYDLTSDSNQDVEPFNFYNLNESQTRAFKEALGPSKLSLVQGPPGTGKTHLIGAVIHHVLNHNPNGKILLVSQSHEAVNNAIEKTAAIFSERQEHAAVVRVDNLKNYLRE